jgi:hypothetical protein
MLHQVEAAEQEAVVEEVVAIVEAAAEKDKLFYEL